MERILETATVYRGGASARRIYPEPTACTFEVTDRGLDFRFRISAAGGGQTSLLLRLEPKSLRPLLMDLATSGWGSAAVSEGDGTFTQLFEEAWRRARFDADEEADSSRGHLALVPDNREDKEH